MAPNKLNAFIRNFVSSHRRNLLTKVSMYFFSYSILLMCSYLCTHFICIMIQWSKHKILLLYKHNILFIYIDFHILKENSYSCSKNDEVWYLHMRAKRLFNIFCCSPPLFSQSHKIPKSFKYGLEWDRAVGNFQIWICRIP